MVAKLLQKRVSRAIVGANDLTARAAAVHLDRQPSSGAHDMGVVSFDDAQYAGPGGGSDARPERISDPPPP